MQKIRVVIADDHAMLREGLQMLLETQPDMEVVGEATEGVEAVEMVRRLQPDVILLDIAMPKLTGLEAISLIRQVSPQTRIIILSSHEKEAYVHQALSEGAWGYIVKGSPIAEVIEAIRKALRQQYHLSPVVQNRIIHSYTATDAASADATQPEAQQAYEQLSEREKQIFHLLIEGNSSHQIGDLLCISSKTVDKHRASLSKKIGVDSPIQMLHYAIRIGIVDPTLWQEAPPE